MTSWSGNVYNREDLGLVWRVDASGYSYVHMYNADDERVWTYQDAEGQGRWTIRDLDNKVLREFFNDGGTWTVKRDYIHRAGALLAAVLPTGQVNHFHADHLGTPRLITANYGSGPQQVAFHAYYPYGVEATHFAQDDERLKFTDHERDLGVGWSAADDLDYMHARYYNPQVGRFLSVDPVSGRRSRPQSWNRYSYVLNNPVSLVDPDGRIVVAPTDRRSKRALNRLLQSEAGRAAYERLAGANGVYTFVRKDSKLTPAEKLKLRKGESIQKLVGHFSPAYSTASGKVEWVSGGTLTIDFTIVDLATEGPYSKKDGDAAIMAHEIGHADHYEEDPEEFVALTYEEQEVEADELRDLVLTQLEKERLKRYGTLDPFAGTGFCSADGTCH